MMVAGFCEPHSGKRLPSRQIDSEVRPKTRKYQRLSAATLACKVAKKLGFVIPVTLLDRTDGVID